MSDRSSTSVQFALKAPHFERKKKTDFMKLILTDCSPIKSEIPQLLQSVVHTHFHTVEAVTVLFLNSLFYESGTRVKDVSNQTIL